MTDRCPRPVFLPPRDHRVGAQPDRDGDRDDHIATLLIGVMLGMLVTTFGVGLGAWVF